jgi:hypothetical protein
VRDIPKPALEVVQAAAPVVPSAPAAAAALPDPQPQAAAKEEPRTIEQLTFAERMALFA